MVTNGRPVIQAVGLTKTFKDFWHRQWVVAVDRLDLDVQEGEVFGLLGPNGSGKSTTIKMLLGLLYPTRGRISVLDRAPTDVAIKSRIGYLPEESYLYRFLNARETLNYYGQLFRVPRQERRRRVEQLLEMVGLTCEARRRVGEYSKGMARRIGLAQALINDPDLLILDEPTTGLDPIGTREIKDLITFLNREKKKTVLLCSHLLADVEDVCQRVTVLYGGRQQAVGSVRELLSQENLTQITTERLRPEAVQRIRHLVEEEEGKVVIDVTSPSAKLETFFLKIVREAQQARHRTSGVTGGGRIADFLTDRETTGEAVIESLMTAADAEVEPVAPEPVVDAEKVLAEEEGASEVIDGLMAEPRAAQASEVQHDLPLPGPEPAMGASETEETDRRVIDNLIHKADQPSDRSKE